MPVAIPPFSRLPCLALLVAARLHGAAPDHVPDIASEGYQEIYRLDLPADAAWSGATGVPYALNQSGQAGSFDRAGYFLELTKPDGSIDWVWASFLTGTMTADELGVPHDVQSPAVRQRAVEGLTVLSNVPGVQTGSFFEGGTLEMWWQATLPVNAAKIFAGDQYFQRFDWADSPDASKPPLGSFQIHNPASLQAVLCWNGWAAGGMADDIGIGNGTPSLDWTSSANATAYSARKLSVWVRPKTFAVTFSQRPQFRQIVVRDRATNSAVVPIAGSESVGGWQSVVLRTRRNGVAVGTDVEQPLGYSAGSASFSFAPTLPAERARYDLEIWLRKSGSPDRLAWRIGDIAVGEAFLVYGQSNAVANYRGGTSAGALGYTSPWVRTFGVVTSDPVQLQHSRYWTVAYPDDYNFYASNIGQWPQALAMSIADEENIPVAVINGARGGVSLAALQRDDAEPENLSDTGRPRSYNRMRYLADQAGIREKLRAVFMYQGEADASAEAYTAGMTSLREDLHADYPALEWIFTTQILTGCGEPLPANSKRNGQRLLEDVFPDVRVTTANGLKMADGCHLFFVGGYQDLASRFFQQARRDLFGKTVDTDSDAPNPLSAGFIKPFGDALLLPWRRPVTSLVADGNALADFVLGGSPAKVTAAEATPAGLRLTLDTEATTATAVSYLGHAENTGWLRNSHGIPPMTFTESLTPRFPSVTLGLPVGASGAVGDPVTLQATATPHPSQPTAPIQSVRILVDGVEVGSVGAASALQAFWTPAASGQHVVTAEVIDANGWGGRAHAIYTASPLLGPYGVTEGIQSWVHGWSVGGQPEGSEVTVWPDSSGRNHGAQAPDAVSRPTVAPERIGLMPALEFQPTDRLTASAGWPSGDWTAGCLLEWTTAANGTLFSAGAGPGAWDVGLNANGQLVFQQSAAPIVTLANPVPGAGGAHVIFADYDSTGHAVRLWLDDSTAAAGSAAQTLTGGSWQLGGSFSGKMGAFALFERRLTDAERAAIRAEWMALAGLDAMGYAAWASATIATPTERGADADPDRDGLANIVEYAFGEPPMSVTGPSSAWFMERDPAQVLLRYGLPSSRFDARVTPQSSSNLSEWAPLTATLNATAAGLNRWSAAAPFSSGRLFLRLAVSPAP